MSKATTPYFCFGALILSSSAHAYHPITGTSQHADTHSGKTELLVEGAAEFGGDDLATVVFGGGENQTIKAGDGLSIHAGFKHKFNADQSILKGTIGYKFHSTSADNSDVGTSSVPLNLSLSQKLEGNWHVSGGLTYQMNSKLEGDGFFQDVTFDDSLGFTLGIGYSFFTLSYTNLDLGINGDEVDASSIGLRFSTAFF
jgi:hypothetical protein